MNELARQKLIEAALSGVRQIKGRYHDDDGGRCAMGVLGVRSSEIGQQSNVDQVCKTYGVGIHSDDERLPCPGCGRMYVAEIVLIIHLNDDHDLDFLEIAHKMP